MRVTTRSLPRRTTYPAVLIATLIALVFTASGVAVAGQGASCDDLLVALTPTGVSGDPYAAAITSQVLTADQPGWEAISWQASPDVEVREVLVVDGQGTVRSLGAATEGFVEDVAELVVCGTQVGSEPEPSGTDATADDTNVDVAEDTTVEAATVEDTTVEDTATDGDATKDVDETALDDTNDAGHEHEDPDPVQGPDRITATHGLGTTGAPAPVPASVDDHLDVEVEGTTTLAGLGAGGLLASTGLLAFRSKTEGRAA